MLDPYRRPRPRGRRGGRDPGAGLERMALSFVEARSPSPGDELDILGLLVPAGRGGRGSDGAEDTPSPTSAALVRWAVICGALALAWHLVE